MSFCKACETYWVFGVAGVCNETETTCSCPEGFNGVDIWLDQGDCHVNLETRRSLHLVLAVFSVFCAIIALVASFYSISIYRAQQSSTSLIFKRSTLTDPIQLRRENLNFNFICLSVISLCVSINYCIENLYFYLTESVLNKFEVRFIQNFTCGVFLVLCMNWSQLGAVAFLNYLPDPNEFGQLIGLSSNILKHPKLAYKSYSINLVASVVVFIIITLFEQLNVGSFEPKVYFYVAFLIAYVFATIPLSFAFLYGYEIRKLLTKLTSSDPIEINLRQTRLARKLIGLILVLATIMTISNYVIFFFFISVQRYTFIFLGFTMSFYLSFYSFVNVIIIYYNKKGLTPFKISIAVTHQVM